jgi:dTDP-glucose 4,6-dehydratase
MKLFVTGGAGFIGSQFIRHILQSKDVQAVVNFDKLTYAGHLENLTDVSKDRRYRFVRGDIADPKAVERSMKGMDCVVNFAAETHVDRSIHDAAPFLMTNVIGTQVLLQAARTLQVKKFVHVSTDEVYGSIAKGRAGETALLNPSSPYSASKAGSDHLVMAAHTTFGQSVMITRAANNYGPFQYPEKFLPLFITRAFENQPLPLYGDGLQKRDWLHVLDHCRGIDAVLRRGKSGRIYNIGTGEEETNLSVARRILKRLGRTESLIRSVPDRLGHDRRYAMNISRIQKELGWEPQIMFKSGLLDLIDWYLAHRSWWEPILHNSKAYKAYYRKQYART